MTDSSAATSTLTLSQIATLARVQRPVVTVWRGRLHRTAGPFPQPVSVERGVERFDRDAIVAWLAASGRGNNPDIAADAALHGGPPVTTADALDVCEALLLLRAEGGPVGGVSRDDLLDRADESDPDDEGIFAEVAAAADADLSALAAFVERLWDASTGVASAWAHLHRDRSWIEMGAEPAQPSEEVVRFIAALTAALAREDGSVLPVVDPTGCASDLVVAALSESGLDTRVFARPVVTADREERRRAVRASWRRLVAHGVAPLPVSTDAEGHVDVTGPGVLVARYPHAGAPRMTPRAVMEAIDDVLLQMKDDQRAVILGPASVLTDALAQGRVTKMRDEALATGRLRALVRFGEGSVPSEHRRRLALWVLGPVGEGFRQGRTAVADLAGLDLAAVGDDLISDVLAAIRDVPLTLHGEEETQGRAHAFAVARYQRTFQVLARTGDLVPRDLRVLPGGVSADEAETAALAARVATPVPGVDVAVSPTVATRGRLTTIRDLIDEGQVAILPGTRLAPEEPASPGAVLAPEVRVVGVPELQERVLPGARVVGLVDFSTAHPRAERTEPGDVVFATAPSPAAWVDAAGGSVVESPARIARVLPAESDARVNPHVLAADIARGRGSQWRAFAARLVPAAEAGPLARVLDSIAAAREAASERAEDLARLTDLLADGAVTGRATVMMNMEQPEGH